MKKPVGRARRFRATAPLVPSSLDAALWLHDRGRRGDGHVQMQQLHCLLYMAQGTYAAVHYGRMLMPAIFVAEENGPIEPTVFHAFEDGRPPMAPRRLAPTAENFLSSIWRKLGHHSTDHLIKRIREHKAYREAFTGGQGTVIPLEFLSEDFREHRPKGAKKIKTQDGRALEKWIPTAKPSGREL